MVILICQVSAQLIWEQKITRILKSSLNGICHIAQPLDKSNLIEPISHTLSPTYPSDIFQTKSHRYGHYVL